MLLPGLRLVHARLRGDQLRADVGQPGVFDIELLVGRDDFPIALTFGQALLRTFQSSPQGAHLLIEPCGLPPRRTQRQLEIGIDVCLGKGIGDLGGIPCVARGEIDADHTAFSRRPHVEIGEQVAGERACREDPPAFFVKESARPLGVLHELQVIHDLQCDVAAGDHVDLCRQIARQLLRLQLRTGDRIGVLGADDHGRLGHISLG